MAEILTQVFEYNGKLTFDTTKSDGLPRKLIDITRLESMDWKYNIDLESGLTKTFIWYLNEQLKG
jgi:GDP-L-fucose synthase